MSEQIELKPCPFCGGVAKVDQGPRGLRIQCEFRNTICPVNMRTHHGPLPEISKEWNTRAPYQEKA